MSPTLAVYLLARCFAGLDWLVWIGAAMTVYPVFFAVMEDDLKRTLAYSSNNQSVAAYNQPTVIIAPRVFRFGARLTF